MAKLHIPYNLFHKILGEMRRLPQETLSYVLTEKKGQKEVAFARLIDHATPRQTGQISIHSGMWDTIKRYQAENPNVRVVVVHNHPESVGHQSGLSGGDVTTFRNLKREEGVKKIGLATNQGLRFYKLKNGQPVEVRAATSPPNPQQAATLDRIQREVTKRFNELLRSKKRTSVAGRKDLSKKTRRRRR